MLWELNQNQRLKGELKWHHQLGCGWFEQCHERIIITCYAVSRPLSWHVHIIIKVHPLHIQRFIFMGIKCEYMNRTISIYSYIDYFQFKLYFCWYRISMMTVAATDLLKNFEWFHIFANFIYHINVRIWGDIKKYCNW